MQGARKETSNCNFPGCSSICISPNAYGTIDYGIFLVGTGEAWVDGLQLQPAARTWTIQNSGTDARILAIKAVDENTVA